MKSAVTGLIGGIVNTLSYVSPNFSARIALKLFSIPKKGKIKAEEAEFLNTANQKILSLNDMDIMTYCWHGDGKTILLAHGWESNSFRWKALINDLTEKGFKVIALDAPAHGKSGSKYFNALIYTEFIKEATNHYQPDILIGHSVGGMASYFYQHMYPEHSLDKLVLLGAPSNFKDVLQRYADLLGYNKVIRQSLSQLIQKRFGYPPEYFSIENFNGFSDLDGLIVHDKRDLIIPFRDAEHIHQHFPNSKLVVTEGFGHGLKQAEVNSDILNFIMN